MFGTLINSLPKVLLSLWIC